MTFFAEMIRWDHRLFFWVNGLSGSWLDYIFGWTTYFGTDYVFVIVLIFMWIWEEKEFAANFIRVVIAGSAGGLLCTGIKVISRRPRPYAYFNEAIGEGKVVIHNLFGIYFSNSFPSGHTAKIFAAVLALNLLYHPRFSSLYILPFVVAVSRGFTGAYFLLDVRGGAAVVCLGSFVALRLIERYTFPKP